MSSVGSLTTSTSSKIRQFGLYRSIDARTEEFLKLSRKRQLRQGCACAVISTLITVTVVVVVLLVFEYGINSSRSSNVIKGSGWFGLMNGSDSMAFEEKFAKTNKNYNRSTHKLLPMIIKALKPNKYLEKVLEDYTTSSHKYERIPATEFTFKRNVFSYLKNVKPSSRLYAVAYKTYPITFRRSMPRNRDYYDKFKKIRDFERIRNYVHKMISENVGSSYTQAVKNQDDYLQSEKNTKELQIPSTYNKSSQKIHQFKNHTANQTVQKYSKHLNLKQLKKDAILKSKININSSCNITKKTTPDRYSTICRCPLNISNLLNKLQASVQQLILDAEKSRLLQPCSGFKPKQMILSNNGLQNVVPTTLNQPTTPFTITKTNMSTLISNPFKNHYIPKSKERKPLGEFDKVSVGPLNYIDRTIQNYISKLLNISLAIKPNIESVKETFGFINSSKPQALTVLSTIKPLSREKKINLSSTCKPDIATTTKSYSRVTKLNEQPKKTLFKNYVIFPVVDSELKSRHKYWPFFTPIFHKNSMKVNYDTKTTISSLMEKGNNEEKMSMKYLKNDIKQLDVKHSFEPSLQTKGKMITMIDGNRFNNLGETRKQHMTPTSVEIIDTTMIITLEENTSFHMNIEQTSETNAITLQKPDSTSPNQYKSLHDKGTKYLDYNFYNKPASDEDFYDDTSPLPTYHLTEVNKSLWFDRNSSIHSMLPQNRPTYLNIQRSDWKNKELADYDAIR